MSWRPPNYHPTGRIDSSEFQHWRWQDSKQTDLRRQIKKKSSSPLPRRRNKLERLSFAIFIKKISYLQLRQVALNDAPLKLNSLLIFKYKIGQIKIFRDERSSLFFRQRQLLMPLTRGFFCEQKNVNLIMAVHRNNGWGKEIFFSSNF
jgi:hypothetical protein